MTYSLLSDSLSIEITKLGIELCSIKSKKSGLEYIWQADPSIWGSHAPVLFPIIGLLKDGYTLINGKKYFIPKHGLVRNSDKVQLIHSTENTLQFRFSWDKETFEKYPFQFQFDVIYSLIDNCIKVEHIVENLGDQTMYYSLGGHPGFNCPLHPGENYEDYYLSFPFKETDGTWLLDENGLVSDQQKSILENSSKLWLNKNIFDHDALIFKNLKSKKVSLNHIKNGPILSLDFEDFEYLGVWAKPGAPFVCIEPWLGIADSSKSDHDFKSKEGILELAPKKSEKKSYSIIIESL
ncbi:aldose 1-epimerase family protein [Algoriphagus sp.]|uniref:aldose 1-epimerase family protein n=1 Tax=Algoriphagus sp. TaxID=1872435 RepID=UPI0025EE224B|nr:aldose 1-epimerase family protein [Algoriphagus sp.]